MRSAAKRSRLSVQVLERRALNGVELAAREYARLTHGNLNGEAYRRREEAREKLLDALSTLDSVRSPSTIS